MTAATIEERIYRGERFTLDYSESGVIEVEHNGEQRGLVFVDLGGCRWSARIEYSGKADSVDDSLNAVFDAILYPHMGRGEPDAPTGGTL